MGVTNVNSLEIGDELQMKYVEVTVSSAELLALYATPKTIVAAPGANKLVEFVGAVIHKPAGTAYAGIAAGENLAIKYTDASGAQVCTDCETVGFLDQTTAQTRIVRPIVTEFTPVANAALVLQILTGEIITGDSPLYVRVHYRIWRNITDATTA